MRPAKSLAGGEVVEVKGVQKLDLMEKIIEFEAYRQQNLINLKKEIAAEKQAKKFADRVAQDSQEEPNYLYLD